MKSVCASGMPLLKQTWNEILWNELLGSSDEVMRPPHKSPGMLIKVSELLGTSRLVRSSSKQNVQLLFDNGVAIKSQRPFGERLRQLQAGSAYTRNAHSRVNEISSLHLIVCVDDCFGSICLESDSERRAPFSRKIVLKQQVRL
jgi:hypothetical protein